MRRAIFQLRVQNWGVSMTSTENISRRPTSIRNELIHLAKMGRSFHDIVGPISVPSVGPTLPILLSVMVMALVLSIPAAIMANAHNRHSIRYMVRKASRVTRLLGVTLLPSTCSGKEALGWSNWINSFFTTLISMTPRMHFMPPLVDPEQAPMNIHTESTTQVTCGHFAASSLKRPVVVMKDTTWNMAERKA